MLSHSSFAWQKIMKYQDLIGRRLLSHRIVLPRSGKRLWHSYLRLTSQIYPCQFLLMDSYPCMIPSTEGVESVCLSSWRDRPNHFAVSRVVKLTRTLVLSCNQAPQLKIAHGISFDNHQTLNDMAIFRHPLQHPLTLGVRLNIFIFCCCGCPNFFFAGVKLEHFGCKIDFFSLPPALLLKQLPKEGYATSSLKSW